MTKKYSFDDFPEHKARLAEYRDKAIASALSTKPMDDAERATVRGAIRGLYEAAKLTPSPDRRIVFVASPISGAIAASMSAGIWWLRKNPGQHKALFGRSLSEGDLMAALGIATSAAVDAGRRALNGDPPKPDPRLRAIPATYAATDAATYAATRDATSAATDDATYAATRAATYAATDAATDAATYAATRAATDDARKIENLGSVASFLVRCCGNWCNFRQGGNHWAGWIAYLSFFRDVAGLKIDYTKWQHYETASQAGPRFIHADFCIVSERPIELHNEIRDGQGRPHRADGPSIRWADGWELHFIAGIRVNPNITAGDFTTQDIQAESNAEVRRVMIDRYEKDDQGRYLRDAGAKVIDSDTDKLGKPRRLLRIKVPGDEPYVAVEVINSTAEPDGTFKRYTLRCDQSLRPLKRDGFGEPQALTCHNAVASLVGKRGEDYAPQKET